MRVSNRIDTCAPFARFTSFTWPITFAPAGIVDPEKSGTSCITRAVMTCPLPSFREFREVFKLTGRIVPAGIVFCANNCPANMIRVIHRIGFIQITSHYVRYLSSLAIRHTTARGTGGAWPGGLADWRRPIKAGTFCLSREQSCYRRWALRLACRGRPENAAGQNTRPRCWVIKPGSLVVVRIGADCAVKTGAGTLRRNISESKNAREHDERKRGPSPDRCFTLISEMSVQGHLPFT